MAASAYTRHVATPSKDYLFLFLKESIVICCPQHMLVVLPLIGPWLLIHQFLLILRLTFTEGHSTLRHLWMRWVAGRQDGSASEARDTYRVQQTKMHI